jgi:TetR/AcrR family tetracycline transcriptional repressor
VPKILRYGELDRETLTAAAVRIAERGGVSAVTMRALATELGLSATATYHHVASKGELLGLVADAVLADVQLPTAGTWQQRTIAFAHSARLSLLRIDGIVGILQTQPSEGAAKNVDATMNRIVVDAGLKPSQREAAKVLMITFIMGSVSLEQAIEGHRHSLTMAHEKRFEQGLRMLIAGLEGS